MANEQRIEDKAQVKQWNLPKKKKSKKKYFKHVLIPHQSAVETPCPTSNPPLPISSGSQEAVFRIRLLCCS